MKRSMEELLQMPYWIIDILPKRVPKNSPGQFFAIENYFLDEPRRSDIRQKHINLILKLNCYMDVSLDERAAVNPDPATIADEMRNRHLCIMIEDSMIVSDPDDTYMTLFHPDEKLLELIRKIAAGEGLFVWKG